MMEREKLYFILGTLFVMIVILSNMMGGKFVTSPFGGIVSVSLFLYPLTFFLSDLLTEIYGGQKARAVIYLGFGMAIFTHLLALLLINIPPQGEKSYQTALETLFHFNGLSLAASLAAYLIAQLVDVKIYLHLKEKTKGRFIGLRTNLSTLISQVIDSFIINIVLFYGFLGWSFVEAMQMFSGAVLLKGAFSIILTPLFYYALHLKRRYAVDY